MNLSINNSNPIIMLRNPLMGGISILQNTGNKILNGSQNGLTGTTLPSFPLTISTSPTILSGSLSPRSYILQLSPQSQESLMNQQLQQLQHQQTNQQQYLQIQQQQQQQQPKRHNNVQGNLPQFPVFKLQSHQQQPNQLPQQQQNAKKSIQFVGGSGCKISLDSSSYDTKTAKALGITVFPENAIILAQRYLIINQISGSSFYNCVDIKSGDSLTCKAVGNSYAKIVSAYFKLDDCKYIKPLHKLLKSKDQTYLLLTPYEHGDLHSFVRERKRLREPEAKHLFRQICKTVKECHEQGIVLRDLKLRKFVFSDKERSKLKFESLEDAVVLEDPDDDILKEKIGCPAYVAPEILKANSDFSGKAADLWSMGVILYTMLVGRYPFNDPEHSSLFAKIARCTFIIPEFVSPKARCLIRSLLQKVPNKRISPDDILDHPWFHENETLRVIGNSRIESFALEKATSSWDFSADDQRVPELDC